MVEIRIHISGLIKDGADYRNDIYEVDVVTSNDPIVTITNDKGVTGDTTVHRDLKRAFKLLENPTIQKLTIYC